MWTFSVSVSGGSNVIHRRLVSASCRRLSCRECTADLEDWRGREASDSEVYSVALPVYFEARVLVPSDIC
jgi:hypothetical protein